MHHYTEFIMRYARFNAAMRMIERVQCDQPVDSSFLELWARCETAEIAAISKYVQFSAQHAYVRQLYGRKRGICSCGHAVGRHTSDGWCMARYANGWICVCIAIDV